MIRVGVFGAAGRMGAEVCRAIAADVELELAGAFDPASDSMPLRAVAGNEVSDISIASAPHADDLLQVAVDFTVAASAIENIEWCLENGVHVVVGTTGLPNEEVGRLAKLAEDRHLGLLIAPNFAIGAVLMMKFAEQAARWLPDAEIIELHHPGKLDAPSGTALLTADRITQARGSVEQDSSKSSELIEGARGAEAGGVRVHSVRLPGFVAHQEVIFGGPGQTLSIRHDSTDRSSFMPGVILAVKTVGNRPGLTLGLDPLL